MENEELLDTIDDTLATANPPELFISCLANHLGISSHKGSETIIEIQKHVSACGIYNTDYNK